MSHVALRHGTAQATKAQKYAVGAGIAGILGTILAGPTVGQLAQLPIGAYFLRYSREYETEADLLGALAECVVLAQQDGVALGDLMDER